jgi:hypothetical protein
MECIFSIDTKFCIVDDHVGEILYADDYMEH